MDNYATLSQKTYHAFHWVAHLDPETHRCDDEMNGSIPKNHPKYDYVLKTDDDCYLRLDTILDELMVRGRRVGGDAALWQGLVYR